MEALNLKPLFDLKALEAKFGGNGKVADGMTGWDILSVDQFDRERLGYVLRPRRGRCARWSIASTAQTC